MKPRTFLALVVLSLTITAYAQSPNPLYLREMPTEDRVVREMQGTDPIDSIARQAGAYEQLRTIVTDLASAQGRDSSHLLPDEKRIADYYEVAASRGWQRVQAAVGTDRKRYSRLTAYSIDPDFKAEVLAKFFTPVFRNVYAKAEQFLKDRHKDSPTAQQQPMPAPAILQQAVLRIQARWPCDVAWLRVAIRCSVSVKCFKVACKLWPVGRRVWVPHSARSCRPDYA
jgi:hypothetical protein